MSKASLRRYSAKGMLMIVVGVWVTLAVFPHASSAKVLTNVKKSIKKAFPDAGVINVEKRTLTPEERLTVEEDAQVELDPILDKSFPFYTAIKDGEILGFALENTIKGKWGPIHFLLLLKPDGAIRDLVILEYRERRGRPVAKKRFRKQFTGKTIEDPVKLKKDIHAVTGATISSRGLTKGVRKLLHIFALFN